MLYFLERQAILTTMGSSKSGSRKLKELTPRKMEKILELLAIGISQSIIGREFNITRGRVWQIAHPDYRKNKTK